MSYLHLLSLCLVSLALASPDTRGAARSRPTSPPRAPQTPHSESQRPYRVPQGRVPLASWFLCDLMDLSVSRLHSLLSNHTSLLSSPPIGSCYPAAGLLLLMLLLRRSVSLRYTRVPHSLSSLAFPIHLCSSYSLSLFYCFST